MGLISKQQILDAKDLPNLEIEVPVWGGSVLVRPMTATERSEWEGASAGPDGKIIWVNYKARLVAKCLVNEDGTRMFQDADAVQLGAKNAAAVEVIFLAASKLNGLSKEDTDNAEKESAALQANGSTSNLPGDSDTPTQP